MRLKQSTRARIEEVATPVLAPERDLSLDTPPKVANRRAFIGFFLIGVLISTPATTLLVWNYHLQPPYWVIGGHFLSFALGVLLTMRTARLLLNRLGTHRLLAISSLVAAIGIVLPEFSLPPVTAALRHASFAILGLALGGIMAAAFQMVQRLYEHDAAATANVSSGLIGLGALVPALFSALSYSWTEFRGLFLLLALVPMGAAVILFRQTPAPEPLGTDLGFVDVLREFRSPVHLLFAALLFFETAAELSVVQWTPLHLVLGSGMSPSAALYFLAFYCLALLTGRFAAQAILRRYSHRRLLLASAAMSWMGISILSSATNFTGAALGLSLAAFGFSFVYPLLVERIGSRFREYHSSAFHGVFGLGMLGGFLAPALIGFWAALSDQASAMILPLWCSLLVFLLLLLLWVESKFNATQVARS